MTLETFLEEFSHVAGLFRNRINQRFLRTPINGECPITAVCGRLTKDWYRSHHVEKAATRIGLPMDVRTIIIEAADYTEHSTLETSEVRKKLEQMIETTQ